MRIAHSYIAHYMAIVVQYTRMDDSTAAAAREYSRRQTCELVASFLDTREILTFTYAGIDRQGFLGNAF